MPVFMHFVTNASGPTSDSFNPRDSILKKIWKGIKGMRTSTFSKDYHILVTKIIGVTAGFLGRDWGGAELSPVLREPVSYPLVALKGTAET